MSLSDTAVKNAKSADKQYKMMDDLGLYLLVKPNGSKLWRMDYQFASKRNTLSFGPYPATKLAEARKKRDTAREALARGEDPGIVRKLEKVVQATNAANTFAVVAEEYLAKLRLANRAAQTMTKNEWLLKTHAADIQNRPIGDIKPIEILAILQRLEKRGNLETATRLRSTMSAVFRLAVSTMRAERDPTQDLKGAISSPVVVSHAAITDEKKFGALMASIEEHDGWPTVRYALKFIAITAKRPGEVRLAEWTEFDLAKRTWTIPAERTKMRKEDEVPLSRQAMEILEEVRGITDRDKFVFASLRSSKKALSENAMNSALKRMGYATEEHVAHGFRSSFSTIMNERGHDPEVIEQALAHQDGSVRGIYNRARYWERRVELMQYWADLVDSLRTGKPLTTKAPASVVEEFEDLL